MDYSGFDWSGGDIGDIEPYQLPKGSTAAGLGDMTSSILSKLGSGISGGLASTGAGVLSGLAGANPYAMGAKVIGDVAQAALGGPTNQTSDSGKSSLKLGGGDWNINFSGSQTNQHTNPDSVSNGGPYGGPSGGPNYWLYGAAALVGLIALKMVSR